VVESSLCRSSTFFDSKNGLVHYTCGWIFAAGIKAGVRAAIIVAIATTIPTVRMLSYFPLCLYQSLYF
jgi:hypothetical protein